MLTVFAGIVAGCASINSVSEHKVNQLVSGKSTKSDIVSALGLPNKVVKNGEDGSEQWKYSNKSISKDFFVALPVAVVPLAGSMSAAVSLDVGPKNVVDTNEVSVMCYINKDGLLVSCKSEGGQ